MRAMVHELYARMPYARFTVVHQFADPSSAVALDVPVDYFSLKLPLLEGLRLALFGVLTLVRVPATWVLGKKGRMLVDRYRTASMVISAPGGPYFGDIYADHEVVHWFYVWLGRLLGRPLFLYAPSVGPFNIPLLEWVRRRGFRWFDGVALRDSVSADYLSQLMGDSFAFEVTADSALQERVEPEEPGPGPHFQLVVAVRDPGIEFADEYNSGVVAAIEAICRRHDTEVVFLPQLHGPRHRDQPYLESLASSVEGARSVKVESDEDIDSNDHRRLIAAADLVIAGRYHPAVFAVAAATPVIVIPYEHKSWGLAREAGIEEWALDHHAVRPTDLVLIVDEMLSRLDQVGQSLAQRRDSIRETALRTTELAIEVMGD